jgi:hypothetical protein
MKSAAGELWLLPEYVEPVEEVKGTMKLNITTPEGYDVACALRGPDIHNTDRLKWALTCRIRHLAGVKHNDTPSRASRLNLSDAEAVLLEAKRLNPNTHSSVYHYLDHVRSAARHLRAEELVTLANALMYHDARGLTAEDVVRLAGGD